METPIFYEEDNIDEEACLKIYDNSYDFYIAVLNTFVRGSRKDLKDLERYMMTCDKESYRVVVHGLKSSAASVGAKQLEETAVYSDQLCKRGNWNDVADIHEELVAQLIDTIELIEKRLNK